MTTTYNFTDDGDRQDALIIGRVYQQSFTVEEDNGDPTNLTGFHARWVLFHASSGIAVIEWTDTGGELTIDGAGGIVTLDLDETETGALSAGDFGYFVEVWSSSGNPLTLAEGMFRVKDRPSI